MGTSSDPIAVALVDDYDVVVIGVANMLEPYRDRVVVAELDTNKAVDDVVDIALYDSFAQPESDHHEVKTLVDNPRARRVVVYTSKFHPELVVMATELGVDGYLSKALTARELVEALEQVHAGRRSSARPRPGPAATAASGPGGTRGSPTGRPRSARSSRRGRTTPRSPR